jgi:hypothetical protein
MLKIQSLFRKNKDAHIPEYTHDGAKKIKRKQDNIKLLFCKVIEK